MKRFVALAFVACSASKPVDRPPEAREVAPPPPIASSAGDALPPVGASCRGKSVDLLVALWAKECEVDKATAERISAKPAELTLAMTAQPSRLRYGDPVIITLTMTNAGQASQVLAFVADPSDNDVTILFAKQATWQLSPGAAPAERPRSGAPHYLEVILEPDGVLSARIDTTFRAMTHSFATCADCPPLREVEWDPGHSFPSGEHQLTAMVGLLHGDQRWSTTIVVLP